MEAEKGLLGTVLLDPASYYKDDVQAEWFFKKPHETLWEVISELTQKSPNWDCLILVEELKKENKLSQIGGTDYLLELQDTASVSAHFRHYRNIVLEMYELRNELDALMKGIDTITKHRESPADDIIASMMKKKVEIEYSNERILDEWKQAQSGLRSSIPTPYPELDRQTGGLKTGQVAVFTGRSKAGKSMFLAHWYNYLAGEKEIPIMVVPLEDRREITIKRMAANFGSFNVSELDAGGRFIRYNDEWKWLPVHDKDIEKGVKCLEHVSKYPVHFYDRKCTAKQLRGVAIRYKQRHGIKAMFLDGAKDLLRPHGKYADISADEEISQQMAALAHELDIAIICVWHLVKLDQESKITVNSIRGSGNIVADSRAVYCLQSGDSIQSAIIENNYVTVYDDEGASKMRVFECLSNNHGGIGSKVLVSDLSRCQWMPANKN